MKGVGPTPPAHPPIPQHPPYIPWPYQTLPPTPTNPPSRHSLKRPSPTPGWPRRKTILPPPRHSTRLIPSTLPSSRTAQMNSFCASGGGSPVGRGGRGRGIAVVVIGGISCKSASTGGEDVNAALDPGAVWDFSWGCVTLALFSEAASFFRCACGPCIVLLACTAPVWFA